MRRPAARLAAYTTLVLAALVLSNAVFAHAKGTKPAAAKSPEWGEESGTQVLHVFDPVPLKAYVYVPSGIEEGKKAGLVVVLHGHGGTATGMLGYGRPIADARHEIWMACEGGKPIDADGQPGHTWEPQDKDGVLACLDACLAKHPVDPKKVMLMGFSMGGTMSLATYATRPSAFAGIFTVSSAEAPSAAQKGARMVVCFGTKDPNISLMPTARQASEKTIVGRCVSIDGNVHNDLPEPPYSIDAFAWILESKAPSEYLPLMPKKPDEEIKTQADWPGAKTKGGTYRHILLFEAGGLGAPPDAPAKAAVKASITALAAEMKKLAPGPAWGDAVAAKSQDPLSKDSRGAITGAVIWRYGGPVFTAMEKLKPGETSAPVESDAGWHLVYRDPAP